MLFTINRSKMSIKIAICEKCLKSRKITIKANGKPESEGPYKCVDSTCDGKAKLK